MEAHDIDSIICPNCHAALAPSESRCSACGASTRAAESAEKPRLMDSKWLNNPWVVLGLCFFALAIFGLPLIWKTRAFSKPAKVVVSLAVVLYTVVILWLFYLVMAWSITRIMDALS